MWGFVIIADNLHLFVMRKIEKLRKEYQSYDKWYYHLTLDSLGKRNLLNNRSQCVNAMNTLAIGQYLYNIGVVQFDWMRNHGHFILYAAGSQCCQLFLDFSMLVIPFFPFLPNLSRVNRMIAIF